MIRLEVTYWSKKYKILDRGGKYEQKCCHKIALPKTRDKINALEFKKKTLIEDLRM